MKIIADNKIPFLKGVFEPFCDIEYLPGNEIDNNSVKDAEVLLIRTRTFCNKELLEGTKVKLIATATIGYDHIDTAYCAENNITWLNAPGCNSGAVQQWFMSALLLYAKNNSIDLTKKVLGVVGVGNVGKKIVKFADILGMQVILNDPPREEQEGSCIFRELETIQRECDIITFHVPLTMSGEYKTYHMLNDEFLEKISPNTLLFNSCRGEVFENEALNKSMISNKNRGLFLDVWENEPAISLNLLQNTDIATPHIAGYSIEGKANGTAAVVRAAGKYFGFPLENWFPEELKDSANHKIKVDCKNKSLQAVVTELALASYPILIDDGSLRNNTNKFESLRSNYSFRNESSAWEVELINETQKIKESVLQLGFKI